MKKRLHKLLLFFLGINVLLNNTCRRLNSGRYISHWNADCIWCATCSVNKEMEIGENDRKSGKVVILFLFLL